MLKERLKLDKARFFVLLRRLLDTTSSIVHIHAQNLTWHLNNEYGSYPVFTEFHTNVRIVSAAAF